MPPSRVREYLHLAFARFLAGARVALLLTRQGPSGSQILRIGLINGGVGDLRGVQIEYERLNRPPLCVGLNPKPFS